MGNIKTTK